MPSECPVTACNGIKERLNQAYRHLGSWEKVAALYGLSKGMAYRIAVHGYEPKEASIRFKLGLPVYRMVRACAECGEVHLTRRCTLKRKYPAHWLDWSPAELKRAFENREAVKHE